MLRPTIVAFTLSSLSLVAAAGLIACSSSDDNGGGAALDGGGGDGGGGGNGDGGGGGNQDAAVDTSVNACKTFVDRSADAAPRKVTWDFSVSAAPERCMTIKKGQTVTFAGNFGTHPLTASGGDTPNPFKTADVSTMASVINFPAAGNFGFLCGNHPSMTGAIKVIE